MMQVRVTMLESYRRFRDEVTETFDTEEKVIESLSGKFEGNVKTEIGSAFHLIIETGRKMECFNDKQNEIALKHHSELIPFIPEIAGSKIYPTKFGEIKVTGHIDVLQGNVIRDTKTKFRPCLMQDYYDSYQWRFYLDILELDTFIYDVFEFVGYDDIMGKNVKECDLIKHEPYECISYDLMKNDLETLLNDFLEWVQYRDLWKYLNK